MSETVPLSVLLEHLKWHLQRMLEDQSKGRTIYFRDAALQRFEFTFQSALKCIQHAAGSRLKQNESPETILNLALQEGWLPQDTDCASLVASLENMNPDHRQQHAEAIYDQLPDCYTRFKFLMDQLCRLSVSDPK